MKLEALFESTMRADLLRMQQELLDAGFDDVKIMRIPQSALDQDQEEDNLPPLEEYGFKIDELILTWYYPYVRFGQPKRTCFTAIKILNPSMNEPTDLAFHSADEVFAHYG